MEGQPEKLPPPKLNPQCLTNGRFPINDSELTMEEFNLAINRQGTYKTPGTDNLRAELVKYLDDRS